MTFAPRNEPSETNSPYQSDKEFILLYLKGQNPSCYSEDYVGAQKDNLIDMFPLISPY